MQVSRASLGEATLKQVTAVTNRVVAIDSLSCT